jgi:hypothetical protein
MGLPVLDVPNPTFEESNPFLAGMKYNAAIRQQQLANQAATIQNQYLGPALAEAQRKAELENQISAPKAEHAEEITLADLLESQNRAKLMGEQAQWYGPKTQSEMALQGAQTRDLTELLPYKIQEKKIEAEEAPTELQIKLMNAMAKQKATDYMTSRQTQMARALRSPELLSLASTNPKIARSLAESLAASIGATQQPSQVTAQTQGQPIEVAPAQNVPQQSNITDADVAAMQRAVADSLVKSTTTAQIQNQRYYANVLDSLFTSGDQLMPSVAKFSGLTGKYGKGESAVKSALGETSPDYSNYLKFTRTLAPALANEMRRTLGGQATDQEIKIMNNVVNPDYWDTNPKQALEQYNYLKELYKMQVSKTIAKTPSEIESSLQSEGSTDDFSKMTDDQLMAIANG